MSRTILTNAFLAYKAQCEATNQPVVMDEFVFALIPNQDHNAPINPNEALPEDAHIKGRFTVTKKGMINPNAVVYSIILGTEIGSWDFNWIGLVNSQTNTVGAISHVKTQSKTQAEPGNNTEGDTLARNIITPYINASNLTQITVTAEVWQLDFNNRLTAIDERIRIDSMDMYGHASFIQDGWELTSSNGAVSLAAGIAYIAGLRCVNIDTMPINLNGLILPKTVYLEACLMGSVNSAWEIVTNITIADSHPPVRTENGITYYSNPIAIITSIDNITDLRPIDWRTAHLDKNKDPHAQYLLKEKAATNEDIDANSTNKKFIELPQLWRVINPIKDRVNEALSVAHSKWTYAVASTTVYGATKLSGAVNSTSEALAATSSAVKKAYDLAASKMTKAQGDSWYWKRGETVTNSTKLNNKTNSTAATGSTIAERESSGDLFARLFRSNYQDESAISGGLAFRKSTSDNYIRFCNNVAAIRTWLSVFSKAEGDGRYVAKSQVSSSTSSTSTTNVANSKGLKDVMDRANAAYNKAVSGSYEASVYKGTDANNMTYPIGHITNAVDGGYIRNRLNIHTYLRLMHTSNNGNSYATDNYTGHQKPDGGDHVSGTWAIRFWTNSAGNVWGAAVQRIL
ncbi:phage tail protein [Aliivibrio sp. S2TY2]|uniref:phage tail-collar fiber domain-containing protein n=1 Tax=unclassified Aliivibrio TaxID=2645654 RepID=UPI002378661F|nr:MULTISPECIES: phage tail protein [unclassified Aliivibrio]MDD9174506.1 phage tail protein [Aliivibrio sp. S3TY1]MDD9191584.1 phage tail protein [Aliivibrio sp. S2TY2]